MTDLRGVTVSEGTMRPEDLIPKFAELLKSQDPAKYEQYTHEWSTDRDDHKLLHDPTGQVWHDGALDWLFDALGGISPEGYYFGAHEGDGACYGFWEVDDA